MSGSGSKRKYLYFGIGLGLALFPSSRKRVSTIVGTNPKINQGLEEFKESMLMFAKSVADVVRKRLGATHEVERSLEFESDGFPK